VTPPVTRPTIETLTLYRLDCDWDSDWRLRDAIRESADEEGVPHFRQRESAFARARELVAIAAAELAKESPRTTGGEPHHERHEAYRWTRDNKGQHWHQIEVTATPCDIRAEEDEHGVYLVWHTSEVVRIVTTQPREVEIDGVKFRADPQRVVVAESPPFVNAKSTYRFTGDVLVPVETRQSLYVRTVTIRVQA
jgi:hypothetical protein